jgi:phage repressor protein C with HTH and peptisase S24 domain
MGIGQNIRFHRERLELTLEQLSALSGVDVGTISALELRDSSRSKYFFDIARGLGLTIEQLQLQPEQWHSHIESHGFHDVKLAITKNFPRVVGTAHMGTAGYYLDLEGGDGYVEFESEPGSIAIRVRGDCMFPAIRDGWYVILEPSGKLTLNEYVLIKYLDGRKMIKELIQVAKDSYTVLEVNGSARMTVFKAELDEIQAISAIVPPSKHKEF